jgi:hypothetical protein
MIREGARLAISLEFSHEGILEVLPVGVGQHHHADVGLGNPGHRGQHPVDSVRSSTVSGLLTSRRPKPLG